MWNIICYKSLCYLTYQRSLFLKHWYTLYVFRLYQQREYLTLGSKESFSQFDAIIIGTGMSVQSEISNFASKSLLGVTLQIQCGPSQSASPGNNL